VTPVVSWGEFAAEAPGLATFGEVRLTAMPAYLGTLRADGSPRVHPVSPIIGSGRLFLFMEPDSPKGHDLRERKSFALHSGVPDTFGTGGEFTVMGEGTYVEDPAERHVASDSAGYSPEDRYILFELTVDEARAHGYGDVAVPIPRRWSIPRA
jgi:hypothetical protein